MSYEEIKVKAEDLVEEVRKLIHEGNVRRVILKDDKGRHLLDVPVNVAAIGAVLAPVLAAIAAVAALIAHFTLVVEREDEPKPPAGEKIDVE